MSKFVGVGARLEMNNVQNSRSGCKYTHPVLNFGGNTGWHTATLLQQYLHVDKIKNSQTSGNMNKPAIQPWNEALMVSMGIVKSHGLSRRLWLRILGVGKVAWKLGSFVILCDLICVILLCDLKVPSYFVILLCSLIMSCYCVTLLCYVIVLCCCVMLLYCYCIMLLCHLVVSYHCVIVLWNLSASSNCVILLWNVVDKSYCVTLLCHLKILSYCVISVCHLIVLS